MVLIEVCGERVAAAALLGWCWLLCFDGGDCSDGSCAALGWKLRWTGRCLKWCRGWKLRWAGSGCGGMVATVVRWKLRCWTGGGGCG